MNNEIKEILDKLYLDFEKAGLTAPEYSDLRDYITNLQEENERLKDIIKEAINYIDDNTYYKDHKGHINIDDVYIILQGEDEDVKDKR